VDDQGEAAAMTGGRGAQGVLRHVRGHGVPPVRGAHELPQPVGVLEDHGARRRGVRLRAGRQVSHPLHEELARYVQVGGGWTNMMGAPCVPHPSSSRRLC
jgi:hypothetical protein